MGRSNVAARITTDLRAKIAAGVYAAGMKIPSRRILAAEYGVAIVTLERALSPLFADGTLHANDRSATYVTGASDSLPAKRSSIAVLFAVPDADDTVESLWVTLWYQDIVRAAIAAADPLQLDVRLINRQSSSRLVDGAALSYRDSIKLAHQQGAAGAIVISMLTMTHPEEEAAEILEACEASKIPAVFLCPRPILLPISHIFYDQAFASYDAVRRLIELGCREIIYYRPWAGWWVLDREQAIAESLADGGIPFSVSPSSAGPDREDKLDLSVEAASELLDRGVEGCGIIAANDVAGQGFIRAAMSRGLVAGRDFAIIGFDDEPSSQYFGLTTLRPPLQDLGAEALRLILRMINKQSRFVQMRLRSEMIERSSTSTRFSRSRPG